MDVVLAHPFRLKALTTGRAKNDKNDPETLAELLHINAVPASRMPPKNFRKLRELTRHRSSLIAELTALKNKIHTELARKGKRAPAAMRSPFTKKHVIWLRSLHINTIDDFLDNLVIVQDKIKCVDERIEESAKDDEVQLMRRYLPSVM